jgi:hypothetical protein
MPWKDKQPFDGSGTGQPPDRPDPPPFVFPATALQPPAPVPLVVQPVMSVADAAHRAQLIRQFVAQVMIEGEDYDDLGDRKVLLKGGAEKLQMFFGLTVETRVVEAVEDWHGHNPSNQPLFSYMVEARAYQSGALVATGLASCNSWETKYRWRWVDESELPPEVDQASLKVRQETISEPEFAITKRESGGKWGKPAAYWDRFEAAIRDKETKTEMRPNRQGAQTKFVIISSRSYRVPSESGPNDANTVLKMAAKRAKVDVIIAATGSSGLFTMDLEDDPELLTQVKGAGPKPEPKPKAEIKPLPNGVPGGELKPFPAGQTQQRPAQPPAQPPALVGGRAVDTTTGEISSGEPPGDDLGWGILVGGEVQPQVHQPTELELAAGTVIPVAAWKQANVMTSAERKNAKPTLGELGVVELEAFAKMPYATPEGEEFVKAAQRVLAQFPKPEPADAD